MCRGIFFQHKHTDTAFLKSSSFRPWRSRLEHVQIDTIYTSFNWRGLLSYFPEIVHNFYENYPQYGL